ncbi:hypothetical protein HQ590_07410 [bacterium]|nr:hypothetical protein [bacterium]
MPPAPVPRPSDPLALVCWLLNRHEARYLVVGAQACVLHGLVRTTEDVDILIEESEDNYPRVIAALSELADGVAAELTPADLRDNVVVKVADEVEVDVSRRAWKVDYGQAVKTVLATEIEGVRVPYASLETLIASKDTYREQDRADVAQLRELAKRRQTPDR